METQTKPGYKTIETRFNTTCRNCEEIIEKGTVCYWTPGSVIHVSCEPKQAEVSESIKTQINSEKKAVSLPRIPDGTYTVVFSDGTHQTIQFSVSAKGAFEGRRIASFLSGSDNETNYTGFAFVTEDNKLHNWKRFEHYIIKDRVMEAVRILYKSVRESGDEAILKAGEEYALRSSKCCKCNRKLTVPASIHRGMGPDCSKKTW